MLTATDCSCTSLDVCALFDRESEPANGSDSPVRLHVTHVGSAASRPAD